MSQADSQPPAPSIASAEPVPAVQPESVAVIAGLAEGRFAGLKAFQQTVRDLLDLAAAQNWSEIILSDASFEDWPLGEAAVVQSLHNWAKTGRKLGLMANDFTVLQRRHPRFVRWRQTWDHIVECRRCGVRQGGALPSAIWTPEWMLHRFEGEFSQGYAGRDPSRRFQMRESLAECLKTSTPGFPATTLGL